MAKSPISRLNSIQVEKLHNDSAEHVEQLNLIIKVAPKKGRNSTSKVFNLRDFNHLECRADNPVAPISRYKQLKAICKSVVRCQKNGYSDETLDMRIVCLKSYIRVLDKHNVAPFSTEGYLKYNDLLWDAVKSGTERKKYLFSYRDGEEVGLKELSAITILRSVNTLLISAGMNISQYDMHIRQLRVGIENSKRTTLPYQHDEWIKMLRRINYFFTSLVTKLAEHKDNHPDQPPPSSLDDILIDIVDGKKITIDLKPSKKNSNGLPFNLMMLAGYLLFAYYTAFNSTVITEVRHPISIINDRKLGRTSRRVKIRGYKGRSHSEVEALFDSVEEENHQISNDDHAGVIIAEVNKRDTNGIEDGVTFIEMLSTLSEYYSKDSFGKLFYFVLNDGEVKPFDFLLTNNLAGILGLTSSSSIDLADFFIDQFYEVTKNNRRLSISLTKEEDGLSPIVKREFVHITPNAKTQRAQSYSYAALSCISEGIELKGVIMPLSYNDSDDNGLDVSFTYEDGSPGKFTTSKKYKQFLKDVESWASKRHASHNGKYPYYLLPRGSKNRPRQWNLPTESISIKTLKESGVFANDYYMSLTAARIRATTAIDEFSDADMGLSARNILQHSLQTQMTNYLNGNPRENQRMISQGLHILTKISQGKGRNEAIAHLKEELDVKVLSYEEYKQLKLPSNPNGFLCKSGLNITRRIGTHYGATKFADNQLGSINNIPCYQYDECFKCSSAQLVDDSHSIYKLISFLDALEDAISLYPENADKIELKIEAFEKRLDAIPPSTVDKAMELLSKNGRYFMFHSVASISQYL
ncbi:hypothetical protein L9X50_09475 [Vibrio aestuarianus]|uniref:hypothetical protein n=1 Tax=Vibrio aestuarianus TaxID=28171 RepID=UPI00237CC1F7|nr:hypothetical protein [Vibrio aestuarianus]MDE1318235.1 hypothetical protein [Vibrio aestuarianus]